MKRVLFLCLFLSSVWARAHADDARGLARQVATCAVIAALEDRLSCYDVLARRSGLEETRVPSDAARGMGKWQVVTSQDPLDDTVQVVVSLVADSGGSAFGRNIVFIARCVGNITDVYISWNEYLGLDVIDMSSNYKYVTLRIGKAPARMERWRLSGDATTTILAGRPEDFLREMAQEPRFIAQITPFWGDQTTSSGTRSVTAIFDTTGMRDALVPLAEACLWSRQ